MSGSVAGQEHKSCSSSDGSQGTRFLSDIFVAALVGNGPVQGSGHQVEASEGSDCLLIHWSAQVVSFRIKSLQPSALNTSVLL
jgi:hypothetical protein